MINPKEYKLRNDVTEEKLVSNNFKIRSSYYKFTYYLYDNLILLELTIDKEDNFLSVNVEYSNGNSFDPFYNQELRVNNRLSDEVIKNYNNVMDNLVNFGILEECSDDIISEDFCDNSRTKTIKIKKLRKEAIIPTKGSKYSAGYDLYACTQTPISINPHKTVKIGTGLAMELPDGFFAGIFARSGLATKDGLRPANCVGVCDEDYRNEYIVPLYNDSNKSRTIMPGERIAQLILLPYQNLDFVEVEELSDTDRGVGGFGSTGK